MTSYSPMTWTLAHARQAELRREADDARLARIARTVTRPTDNRVRRQFLVPSQSPAR
jgi:hypothetical protein